MPLITLPPIQWPSSPGGSASPKPVSLSGSSADRLVQLAQGTQATYFPGSQSSIVNNQPLLTSTTTGQPFTLGSSTQSFGGSGSTGIGAGQGPGTQSTGQAADNPFNNSFNFQIPQPAGGSMTSPTTGNGGGYGQYLPVIVVGVIVAGLGYYLFQRKK